jgi:hypothetical protein
VRRSHGSFDALADSLGMTAEVARLRAEFLETT